MAHRPRGRPRDWPPSSPSSGDDDDLPAQEKHFDPDGICVDEHGTERGLERFPRGSELRAPRIATWRNNLTALSQHRNLYFVGCAHQIFVYQPSGYAHTIGSKPALILTPTMKNPDATGYISVHVPHAINSIIVGDLGKEEILLLATDSGNVAAYRTEHIHATIQDRARSNNLQNPEISGARVECFFTDWVGESAWGLAIHKYARLIAVSANTSDITVYAFALVDRSVDSDSDEGSSSIQSELKSQSEWLSITTPMQYTKLRRWSPQRRRGRNLRLTLYGHGTNIPNISFLNSDLDPEGNWLFSTDIDNKLLAWRLWDRPKPVHTWDFDPFSSERRHPWDNRPRGWNVLPVDPRTFRAKPSTNLACGGPVPSPGPGGIYDLSSLVKCVPDSSVYYRFLPPEHLPGPNTYPFDIGGPPSDENFSGSFASSPSDSDIDIGAEGTGTDTLLDKSHDAEELRERDTGQATASQRRDSLLDTTSNNPSSEQPTASQHLAHVLQLHSSLPSGPNRLLWSVIQNQGGGNAQSQTSETDESLDLSDVSEDDMSETGSRNHNADDTLLLDESSAQAGEQDDNPEASDNLSDTADEAFERLDVFTKFPILHFSESEIRLIPSPTSRTNSVLFRTPLYQAFRETNLSLENCDRFNMIQPIPELGVIVAASQKGRVAIISLTEVEGHGRYFRVDRIVPFESQEKFGLRPLCPLLGIAVGPVESHLRPVETLSSSSEDEGDVELQEKDVGPVQNDQPEPEIPKSTSQSQEPASRPPRSPKRERWNGSEYSRRYRLFLMFCDHTVMHYELYYDWPRGFMGHDGKIMHDAHQAYSIRP